MDDLSYQNGDNEANSNPIEAAVFGEKENSVKSVDINMDTNSMAVSSKPVRKSNRPKKVPSHLIDSITDGKSVSRKGLGAKTLNRPRQIRMQMQYTDFKCDHCGSRYVVNPMRRGHKVSTSKYKAAPRHKIDPESQKILTLCNACGLKFGREKKDRVTKAELSEEEQRKFVEEGERFGKELELKLCNSNASILYCANNAKKNACGCIQKFICGTELGDGPLALEEIMARAQMLLDFVEEAAKLKTKKCYDPNTLEAKPGKRNVPKIGLGNGHRKSKEFEDFVLSKRLYLRNDLKLCEKATQKILSYSNNFLHKRMKTDPEKGIRVERQKGKAAMGRLKPIEDLALEPCCGDNCVSIALTHGRLLKVWRDRAISGQVEARRVLAEMLTPSGGNRANCYKFISWVTGCSNTTIGKVNDQMQSTGGDREPPEHGLKKYWRYNTKGKETDFTEAFVPSYQILQTAASSAGLSTMMQDISAQETKNATEPPKVKKVKRKQQKVSAEMKGKKLDFARAASRLQNTIKIVDSAEQNTSNLSSNFPSTVIALNGHFPSNGFISIPAALSTDNNLSMPSAVSLQTLQHQLQQQQQQTQLQLQIQLLQQQLQNSQNACAVAQTTGLRSANEGATEYIVTPTAMEQHTQVQSVGTSVVVQTVATPQSSVMHNVAGQTVVQNGVVNTEAPVIPTIVAQAANNNVNFLTSAAGNVSIIQPQSRNVVPRTAQNISLVTSPLRNSGEISIIAAPQNNTGSISVLNTPTQFAETPTNTIETYRQVHLITTQQPPTIAISQPVTISLQTSSLPLSTLPTMLLAQTTPSGETQQQQLSQTITHPQQQQQLIIQQQQPRTAQRANEQLVLQRALTTAQQQQQQQRQNSNQIIVHPSIQTNTEQSSTMLPPITSFNADAFLTNSGVSCSQGGTTYAVISNASLADIQPRDMIEEQDPSATLHTSFLT